MGHMVATLEAGDIPIVTMSPPTATSGQVAAMGADGLSGIHGLVSITTFHLDPNAKPDRIDGSVNAAGTADAGGDVNVTGTFSAPVCD